MKVISWLFILGVFLSQWLPAVPAAAPPELSGAPAAGEVPGVRFEHINSGKGLSGQFVLSVLQDSLGFIWIATDDGLDKYDGYSFTVYKHDPDDPYSLSASAINALYEDRNQVLWVGTTNGLSRLDRQTDRFIRYQYNENDPASLSYNRVRAICQDQDGALWVATLGGLNRLDPETGQFERFLHDENDPASLISNQVWDVSLDRQGVLWVGTSAGLDRFDRAARSFIHYRPEPDTLASRVITKIIEDRRGVLWVGSEGGLYRFDRQLQIFDPWPDAGDASVGIGVIVVRALLEDRSGALWVGGDGSGLIRLSSDRQNFVHYMPTPGDPYSLSSVSVIALYQDRAGAVWVGTTATGVDRVDPQASRFMHYFSNPNQLDSLGGNLVNGIFQDRQGTIWVGAAGGGLNVLDAQTGQFKHYHPEPGNPNSLSLNVVVPVYGDARGNLWIGTWGGGLDRLDVQTGHFIHYRADPQNPRSLSSNIVATIAEDCQGNMWIGTWGGGLNRLDPVTDTFTRYLYNPSAPGSLRDNRVSTIFVDRRCDMWVGLIGGGLAKYAPATDDFIAYQFDSRDPTSLGQVSVYDILEDHAGRLWVATGSSLDWFDQKAGVFHHYTEKDGFPAGLIVSILEDNVPPEQGGPYLWVSTVKGLSRFDPDTGEVRNYDAGDGLKDQAFRHGSRLKADSGLLYFGGSNGLTVFDPLRVIKDNPYIPPVVLTGFQVFNRPVAIGGDSPLKQHINLAQSITLNADQSVFSFEFAALNFTAPEKNQYAYKMEGVDRDWVYTRGDRRFVTYTNLDPGNYVFHVKASNNDGIWNETGLSLKLNILPPWWETWWFRSLALLFTAGLLIGGYCWQIRTARRQKAQLEKLVAERTRELSDSQQRFKELSEATFEGIVIHDQGVIVEVNHAALQLFGYERAELLGQHINLLIQDAFQKLVAEYVRQQRQASYQIDCRRKDGTCFVAEVHARQAPYQGRTVRVAAVRDITQHITVEETLRKLYRAVEQTDSTIVITDLNARIEFVNPAFSRVTGYTIQEALGQNPSILKSGETPPEVYADLWRKLRRGDVWQGELLNRKKNGELFWENAIISPVRNASGEVTHYLAVKDDITRRKQAETLLRESLQKEQEARQAAQAANRAKSIFLANMSHELRTPLNAILGFSELMAGDATLKPAHLANLEIINRNGEYLLELINQILEISKIEAGQADLYPTAFDLQELLRGLEDVFALRAQKKHLRLQIERGCDTPSYIAADQGKLRQVLINLLGNAIKFTQRGFVKLSVSCFSEAEAQPDDSSPSLRLTFTVEDSGVGIAADELSKIFEPFMQAEEGRRSMQGTGLGLAISRQFVELMGGQLAVRSQPGVGSTFWFDIPVVIASKPEAEAPALRVTGLAPGQPVYRILIAEDTEANRLLLMQLLRSVGFEVQAAVNGEEAIAIWQEWRPNLIFMDLRMPVMDGYEATRRIKTADANHSTAIVALTASAFEEDRVAILALGCSDFIRKPYRQAQIFQALQKYLGVQYLYAAETSSTPQVAQDAQPAALLTDWKDRLYQATVAGDIGLIYELIEEVRPVSAAFARQLTRLAENYDYQYIRDLLELGVVDSAEEGSG